MATTGVMQIFRKNLAVDDVTTSRVFWTPRTLRNITIRAIGSIAAAIKVEETYSDEAAVQAGTATWEQVDATLDSVGTTAVKFVTPRLPTAFRVSQIAGTRTGNATFTWA